MNVKKVYIMRGVSAFFEASVRGGRGVCGCAQRRDVRRERSVCANDEEEKRGREEDASSPSSLVGALLIAGG